MSDYARVVVPRTVRLERILPGPIEHVWAYLTESDKRGQWLARGSMELRVGGKVELHFHHAELSPEPGPVPERYKAVENGHDMVARVTICEPPRRLAFTWGDRDVNPSEVLFELTPIDDRVRLVVTHSKLPNRGEMVGVSGGWHSHLAVLVDRLHGRAPINFWRLHAGTDAEYERRIPPD